MNDLVISDRHVSSMSDEAIQRVRAFEADAMAMPQSVLETDHVLHGGQYTRTIFMPAGLVITGALIKVPTTLVVCGECQVFLGDCSRHLTGYHVLAASAGRKQAFAAIADTYLTMSFPTQARTVEDAEREFTDEAHLLLSRSEYGKNVYTITGE
ncbi:hypothetical protein UFOVP16_42 [uncultured Caudovirales phage]|uniref:Uncharacterized protein n=1 Tax=uncultured Caudovirales phage TaxID=2100421 RepID=A0A6J5KLI7_9CAUD|nr:hypothetical protein UFOVP16_42 [uncultured Caudovirales phage]